MRGPIKSIALNVIKHSHRQAGKYGKMAVYQETTVLTAEEKWKVKQKLTEQTKYKGYGYHGGGRKPSPPGEAKRTTISICGSASEITMIRELAEEASKSISRFLIEKALEENAAPAPELPCLSCEYADIEYGTRDIIASCTVRGPANGDVYACEKRKKKEKK